MRWARSARGVRPAALRRPDPRSAGAPGLDLAILAGGRGRRLGGVTKPLLRGADGSTLLERLLRALGPLADQVWVVAPADLLAPLASSLGPGSGVIGRSPPRWLPDPGEGPVWGLLAAARASRAPRLLACAADLVAPSPRLARRLLDAAPAPRSVWVVGRDPEPLFSVVDRAALLRAGAVDPPRAAHRLLARTAPRALAPEVLLPEERAGLEDVDDEPALARAGLTRPRATG